MTLSLDAAVAATNATVRNGGRFPRDLHIVTDTRALNAGQTYLALRGERFNGHDYIEEALRRGASAIVADHAQAVPEHTPALIVADTKRAYMALAGAARSQFGGRVIAITGSTGKTTTKVLLAQLLAEKYGAHVAASPANENNEIGVSKLLLSLDPTHSVAVVEMGARHNGDILPLVEIAQPHIGILTNIGEAHLEIMGSHENLIATKWQLFSGGAQAVLNSQDAASRERAASLDGPPLWFGVGDAYDQGAFVLDHSHLKIRAGERETQYVIDVRLPGAHNLFNLSAAICAALALDVAVAEIVAQIPELKLPSGRYETIRIPGQPRIIFDAYNASLSGMLATLDAFSAEPGTQRIAVLASMAELGAQAVRMHEQVGERAVAIGIDRLLVGGNFAEDLANGAKKGGLSSDRIVRYRDNAEAARWLRAHANVNDVVLLKGSRVYKLEEIIEELRA